MQDPIIVAVLKYWETLRAGRVAPSRGELDPRQISSVLEHTFILEYNNIQDIRFRLAGKKLCDIMGMELRGMPANSLLNLGSRAKIEQIIDDLITTPKIVELYLTATNEGGKHSSARMLLLPLQNETGMICRILGCLSARGPLLQRPQRFNIAAVKPTRIIAQKQADPSALMGDRHQLHRIVETDMLAQRQVASPYLVPQTSKPMARERPYLRLVKNE